MQPDIVIVGAGPVGLWTAIQIKKRRPEMNVLLYERHEEYQRSHVLKLEHLSMLLYGKNSKDPHEKYFYKEVTGKNLRQMFQSAAGGSVLIRTNDLESALKTYAQKLGIGVSYEKVLNPEAVMKAHPQCRHFVAADGSKSLMRSALLGESAVNYSPLQYVAEVKYEASGMAGKLGFMNENYKTNKLLTHVAFEHVGKEKDGLTPVTLRFFVDKETYDALPQNNFANPLTLKDARIPDSLAQDIRTYMNVRKLKAGEECREDSCKLGKITFSLYAAKKFAVMKEDRGWFFVGDAAMGVPYLRALNSGLIIGSQLGFILTRKSLSPATKVRAFNFCRPFDVAWEFTAARNKNLALNSYDLVRRAGAAMPWKMLKWDKEDAADFQTRHHQAFRPGDDPQP